MARQDRTRVAILDDYFSAAPAQLKHLHEQIEISSFPDTLDSRTEDGLKQLVARLQPFEIICTMRERTVLSSEVLRALPNLKVILTTGTKNASIDLGVCKELGISAAGTLGGRSDRASLPHNSLDATMEQTWALILGLAHNTARDDLVVKQGGWQTSPVTSLKGKTLALLGLGKLGYMTAKVAAHGFGMKVIAWSTNLTQKQADEKAQAAGLPQATFEVVSSKNELFERADILSVHYVLSDRSRDIVGAKELALMKSTALIVNTSRGPLINEGALLDALRNGRIGGAGLDVYDLEPLPQNSPWRTLPWGQNGYSPVLLSPHMGYVADGVLESWYDAQAENIERYLRGEELLNEMA